MYRILIAILLLIYSCEEPGCTDPDACNYAPEATEDAGNCEYVKEGFCDCYENIKDILDACGGGGPDSAYDETGNCIFDWLMMVVTFPKAVVETILDQKIPP